MGSPQTLSESERRVLARWAAACADHVLPLYTPASADDHRIYDALARVRAFADGKSTAAAEIRLRMVAFTAASAATDAAGAAAARAVAQAAAVAHLGAHALGAAAYAVKAVTLARADQPAAGNEELLWQLAQLTEEERQALRLLPALGTESGGPLGSGLLTKGVLGQVVRRIQDDVAR